MGAFLPKPITTKVNDKGSDNQLTWNCCSMQGWRVEMEDAHITKASVCSRLSTYSLFAVFDGHAGKEVARVTASEFTDHLLSISPFDKLEDKDEYKEKDIIEGLHQAFQTWDKKLRSHPTLLKQGDRSGSTATGVLITPKHYFIFNVGDSRSILIKDKKLHFSSEDHKPMNDGEKRRIEEAGGRVMIQRINGSLAVSRALGDFEYKQRTDRGDLEQLVSPDPEVTCIERDEQDNYMMVACDGIYDVMSNEEIVEFLNDRFTREENEGNICNNLLDLCLYKGSRDNMSSIIISFDKGKVKQDSEKVKEDKQLNEDIRSFVKEYIDRHNGPDSSIHIEGLLEQIQQNGDIVRRCHPDQYGILAKRGLIQNIFESLTTRQSGDSA